MINRTVGRIISIVNNSIIAELYNNLGNYVNVYDGIRFVGEIGSYVSIMDVNRKIICEIVGVDEKNDYTSESFGRVFSSRCLRLGLIGEIINNNFRFGVTKMPPIFSEINIITESDLELMLDVKDSIIDEENGKSKLKSLTIGKSVIFPDYDVKVKLNDFFGFHFAIFGNTGSGKSNTVARIIQDIFTKKNYSAKGAKFVVFDSNGEYKSAFSNISGINDEIKFRNYDLSEENCDGFQIPVWTLSIDDWAVLLRATEKTQVPVLKRALEIINLFNDPNPDEEITKLKNHILAYVIKSVLSNQDNSTTNSDKIVSLLRNFKTNEINLDVEILVNVQDEKLKSKQTVKFYEANYVDFGKFKGLASMLDYCDKYIINNNVNIIAGKKTITYNLSQFEQAVEFAIIYEGSINSSKIYEYTSTLVTRLRHLIESDQGKFFKKSDFTTVDEYVENLIGNYQIINIDVSSLDDIATEVVTKVLSKLLFDYLKKLKIRNSMPINLILEEAHRYVKDNLSYGALEYNIFERIAKEGRKFGLLLGIASQRPSELSKTVVSQCSNFIIHRMQNPDDIFYISRMVPYINQSILDRITYLRRGHALVFGTAINLPTITMINKANPIPYSENSNISELWYKA